MIARFTLLVWTAVHVVAQTPPAEQPPDKQTPPIRYVESGKGVVGVNPAQPYRPIPVNSAQPRDSIFTFYLRVLNPRQINWGTENSRRAIRTSDWRRSSWD
jgi:hypothetical protein